jgi:hypothetical protein
MVERGCDSQIILKLVVHFTNLDGPPIRGQYRFVDVANQRNTTRKSIAGKPVPVVLLHREQFNLWLSLCLPV